MKGGQKLTPQTSTSDRFCFGSTDQLLQRAQSFKRSYIDHANKTIGQLLMRHDQKQEAKNQHQQDNWRWLR